MRKTLVAIIMLGIVPHLAVFTGHTFASPKPTHIKNSTWGKSELNKFCDITGGSFNVERDGKFSCLNSDTGIAINCDKAGQCKDTCGSSKCGNDGKLTSNNSKVKPVTVGGALANSSKIPAGGSGTAVGLTGAQSPQRNAVPGSPPIVTPSRQAAEMGGGAFAVTTSKSGIGSTNGPITGPAGATGRRLP
jgi:hypothetical protein